MRQNIQGPLPETPRNVMRRVGYGEHLGREGVFSYTKRIHGSLYPRFHAYVDERGDGMTINLHLDQKQASHEGSHMHSGEYEGPTVEREMARIVEAIGQLRQPSSAKATEGGSTDPEGIPKKKSFWGLFNL